MVVVELALMPPILAYTVFLSTYLGTNDSKLGHVAFAVEIASHGLVKTITPKLSAARLEGFQKHREDVAKGREGY